MLKSNSLISLRKILFGVHSTIREDAVFHSLVVGPSTVVSSLSARGRHCGQYFGNYIYQKYLHALLGKISDSDWSDLLQVYLSCLYSDYVPEGLEAEM